MVNINEGSTSTLDEAISILEANLIILADNIAQNNISGMLATIYAAFTALPIKIIKNEDYKLLFGFIQQINEMAQEYICSDNFLFKNYIHELYTVALYNPKIYSRIYLLSLFLYGIIFHYKQTHSVFNNEYQIDKDSAINDTKIEKAEKNDTAFAKNFVKDDVSNNSKSFTSCLNSMEYNNNSNLNSNEKCSKAIFQYDEHTDSNGIVKEIKEEIEQKNIENMVEAESKQKNDNLIEQEIKKINKIKVPLIRDAELITHNLIDIYIIQLNELLLSLQNPQASLFFRYLICNSYNKLFDKLQSIILPNTLSNFFFNNFSECIISLTRYEYICKIEKNIRVLYEPFLETIFSYLMQANTEYNHWKNNCYNKIVEWTANLKNSDNLNFIYIQLLKHSPAKFLLCSVPTLLINLDKHMLSCDTYDIFTNKLLEYSYNNINNDQNIDRNLNNFLKTNMEIVYSYLLNSFLTIKDAVFESVLNPNKTYSILDYWTYYLRIIEMLALAGYNTTESMIQILNCIFIDFNYLGINLTDIYEKFKSLYVQSDCLHDINEFKDRLYNKINERKKDYHIDNAVKPIKAICKELIRNFGITDHNILELLAKLFEYIPEKTKQGEILVGVLDGILLTNDKSNVKHILSLVANFVSTHKHVEQLAQLLKCYNKENISLKYTIYTYFRGVVDVCIKSSLNPTEILVAILQEIIETLAIAHQTLIDFNKNLKIASKNESIDNLTILDNSDKSNTKIMDELELSDGNITDHEIINYNCEVITINADEKNAKADVINDVVEIVSSQASSSYNNSKNSNDVSETSLNSFEYPQNFDIQLLENHIQLAYNCINTLNKFDEDISIKLSFSIAEMCDYLCLFSLCKTFITNGLHIYELKIMNTSKETTYITLFLEHFLSSFVKIHNEELEEYIERIYNYSTKLLKDDDKCLSVLRCAVLFNMRGFSNHTIRSMEYCISIIDKAVYIKPDIIDKIIKAIEAYSLPKPNNYLHRIQNANKRFKTVDCDLNVATTEQYLNKYTNFGITL